MTPPWQAWKESLQKPPYNDCGYFRDDKPHSCSWETLVEACRTGDAKLVWTPDSPAPVVPEEIPLLFDLHKSRAIKSAWGKIGGFFAFFLFLALLLSFEEELPGPGSPGFFFLVVLLLGSAWGAWELIQAHKLTPQQVASSSTDSWYTLWLSKQKCPQTWLLIGAIALCACLQLAAPDAIARSGLDPAKVLEGEVWRLLSAPMLHARPSHLYWNLTALYFVGKILEAHGQQKWLVAVFAVSAVIGGLFSVALPPDKISVGASGGILGLYGFLGVLAWRNREETPGLFKQLLTGIGLTALIGFVGFQFIDNAAHLGGLLAGLGMGALIVPRGMSQGSARTAPAP